MEGGVPVAISSHKLQWMLLPKVVKRTDAAMLGTEGSLDAHFLGLSATFDATEHSGFWDTSANNAPRSFLSDIPYFSLFLISSSLSSRPLPSPLLTLSWEFIYPGGYN